MFKSQMPVKGKRERSRVHGDGARMGFRQKVPEKRRSDALAVMPSVDKKEGNMYAVPHGEHPDRRSVFKCAVYREKGKHFPIGKKGLEGADAFRRIFRRLKFQKDR